MVGYYHTVVGYYRIIAPKVPKSLNSGQYLLRTQKNVKIGPITKKLQQSKKTKKMSIFFRLLTPTGTGPLKNELIPHPRLLNDI